MDNSWRTLTLPPFPGVIFFFFCSDRKQSYTILHNIRILRYKDKQKRVTKSALKVFSKATLPSLLSCLHIFSNTTAPTS